MSPQPAPPPEERLVLRFASIHDVLAAKALAQAHGVWCDMVPAPRELSNDCGMVLELAADGWERLAELRAEGSRLRGAYRWTPAGHAEVWTAGGA